MVRLSCSTSNTRRKNGGTAYYCVPRSDTNILCTIVDEQISYELEYIQVASDLIPLIRAAYTDEIAEKLGHRRPSDRSRLEKALKAIDEEEARALQLYVSGKITDRVWDGLWAEWQDRRRILRAEQETMEMQQEVYITNLDAALQIIANAGILYNALERGDQKTLLREMVERVVVNPAGDIIRLDLLPPFDYLRRVTHRVVDSGGKTKTSPKAGQCSEQLLLSDSGGIRTHDQVLKRHLRYHCATEPYQSIILTKLARISTRNPPILTRKSTRRARQSRTRRR